ncbi:flagellar hook-length control protein FliK [Bacillus sp. J37]|uniref:flagellar hook-length control protein FliK n=1 Tax=Bacillus sp. J37 TaxID=935837 RepID=UPI00047C101E|nr:flagellar hook-length control protein FliK [Bacillus sp. J37]
MEIAPFSRRLNPIPTNIGLSEKSSSLSFRNILSQEGKIQKLTTVSDTKSSAHENISLAGILKDLTELVNQLPSDMNTLEFKYEEDNFYNSPEKLDLFSNDNDFIEMTPILFLINNELSDVFAESPSINELIENVETQPSIVNLLTIVKAFESFSDSEQQSNDFQRILEDVNTYLSQEFSSFKNKETPSFKNMLQSISKMNSDDQTILEGEVLLDRFINQGSDKTNALNKLLIISNGLDTLKHETLKTDLLVKKDIMDKLNSILLPPDSLELIENFINKSDLKTIQLIFLNTVKYLLKNNANVHEQILNNYENDADYLGVMTKSKKGNFIKLPFTETNRFNEEHKFYKDLGLKSITIDNNNSVLSSGNFNNILHVQMIDNPIENDLQVEQFINRIKEDSFVFQIKHIGTIENEFQGPIKSDSFTRQEFTNQLLNAFKTSKFAQMPNGANRLTIKLNPEHLGVITVKLVQKNGEMIARLITSSGSAKELLDHSIHQLKQVLPNVQIEIERFEVQTEHSPQTIKDQSENREDRSKEEQQQSHDDENNNEQSFMESLKAALNTTV